MIRIKIHHKRARGFLVALEIAAFLALSLRIGENALASRAAEGTGAEELNRGIELDPGNAEYYLRLARLELYSVANANPDLALAHLAQAAELSPRHVQVWLELSAAHGFQGNTSEAESFLLRADRLAPRIPSVQWVVGNFFLLQGNTDASFRHFRNTLDATRRYDTILFRTAWKSSGDGAKILDELIPSRLGAEFSYLSFLLADNKLDESLALWKRIAASPEPFDASRAARLLNQLLQNRRPEDATQVWNDLRSKNLIKPTYQPTAQNLMINGDFEEDLLNAGFDWRVGKTTGARAQVEQSVYRSPSHAMRVTFDGKTNLHFAHVYQVVRVEPNRKYKIEGYLKTEGISTDSGVHLSVRDFYNPASVLSFSDGFTGTTPNWTVVTMEFKTSPATELVVVGPVRRPSRKLDNLIAGSVWIDDVKLVRVP